MPLAGRRSRIRCARYFRREAPLWEEGREKMDFTTCADATAFPDKAALAERPAERTFQVTGDACATFTNSSQKSKRASESDWPSGAPERWRTLTRPSSGHNPNNRPTICVVADVVLARDAEPSVSGDLAYAGTRVPGGALTRYGENADESAQVNLRNLKVCLVSPRNWTPPLLPALVDASRWRVTSSSPSLYTAVKRTRVSLI